MASVSAISPALLHIEPELPFSQAGALASTASTKYARRCTASSWNIFQNVLSCASRIEYVEWPTTFNVSTHSSSTSNVFLFLRVAKLLDSAWLNVEESITTNPA